MKNEMKKTIISLLTLSIVFLLFSCREKPTATATGDTTVEWRKKNWDFGNISQGEEVAHTFYFKNTGEHNLIVKKIETGCGCTTADYTQAPISPGKEGKIEITFNSTGRYGKQYKEIRIFANIPEQQATVSFTANVLQ